MVVTAAIEEKAAASDKFIEWSDMPGQICNI
jgi:hypothetical protein